MKRRDVLVAAAAGVAGAGCSARPGGDGSPTPTRTPAETAEREEDASTQPAPFAHAGTLDGPIATNGDYPADPDPADGFPPAFPDPPDAPDVDESSFEAREVNGETVPLAPIDVVERWYRRSDARFVDARALPQYEASHVYGSVMSTARLESSGGAIEDWPSDERVVTFCGCPHHLALLRGAGLRKAGHARVYALDEGYGEWSIRDYPMAGTRFAEGEETADPEGTAAPAWTIAGRVDPGHAGEYVLASVDRRVEAAPIRSDGRFTLTVRVPGATEGTPVRLTTPEGTVTRALGDLASDGPHPA